MMVKIKSENNDFSETREHYFTWKYNSVILIFFILIVTSISYTYRSKIGSNLKFYKTDSGELEVMTQSDDDDDDDYNDVINDVDSNPQNHNGGPSNGGGGAGSEGDDIQHEVDFGDDVKNGGKITRRTNRRGRSTFFI